MVNTTTHSYFYSFSNIYNVFNLNSLAYIALLIFVLILSILISFLPSIIAIRKNHPNVVAIFVLNLFLGWTFLGWVIALIWAFYNSPNKN
jgi:hypothetical protein